MAASNSNSNESDLSDLLADALNDFNLEPTDKTEQKPLNEFLKMLNDEQEPKEQLSSIPSEEEFEKMFQEFAKTSVDPKAAENVMPLLESMMQSILSKDLLYPPLKELCDKYPDWLADHRQKLEKDNEFEKYDGQFQVVQKLVAAFERKDHKFEEIFELMQQMQSYGHPPKELVGSDTFPAGPQEASGQAQCPIQ